MSDYNPATTVEIVAVTTTIVGGDATDVSVTTLLHLASGHVEADTVDLGAPTDPLILGAVAAGVQQLLSDLGAWYGSDFDPAATWTVTAMTANLGRASVVSVDITVSLALPSGLSRPDTVHLEPVELVVQEAIGAGQAWVIESTLAHYGLTAIYQPA